MPIPFPSFRAVEEQAEDGVPAAKLLIAAIELLSETDDFDGRSDMQIYEEIKATAL